MSKSAFYNKDNYMYMQKAQIVTLCKYIINHIDEIYDESCHALYLHIECLPDQLVSLKTIYDKSAYNLDTTEINGEEIFTSEWSSEYASDPISKGDE